LGIAGAQKPGFFLNFGEDTKIIAETRFLGLGAGAQKPGFFLNFGEDTKSSQKPGFLDLGQELRNRVFNQNNCLKPSISVKNPVFLWAA